MKVGIGHEDAIIPLYCPHQYLEGAAAPRKHIAGARFELQISVPTTVSGELPS